MAARVKVQVRPMWRRERDEGLGVDVARIVGYFAAASDGWHGKVRTTWRAARLDAIDYTRGGESSGVDAP